MSFCVVAVVHIFYSSCSYYRRWCLGACTFYVSIVLSSAQFFLVCRLSTFRQADIITDFIGAIWPFLIPNINSTRTWNQMYVFRHFSLTEPFSMVLILAILVPYSYLERHQLPRSFRATPGSLRVGRRSCSKPVKNLQSDRFWLFAPFFFFFMWCLLKR